MLASTLMLVVLAAALSLILGLALDFAARGGSVESDPRPLIQRIDALLPQTQCGQCGYAGCKPYAKAIVAGAADINQCPPGGERGVLRLAELLGVAPKPLNPAHGEAKAVPTVARIVEADCIGCTKCIQACPVDAIIGAAQQMHSVIASECTGCELCIPPCPVDCIVMEPLAQSPSEQDWPLPEPSPNTLPCIRCGECVEACPAKLLPQQLYWHVRGREYDKAQALNLFDCIECNHCAQVCPSHIPLLPYYQHAKSEIRAERRRNQQANHARDRYESRQQRLEHEQLLREAERARRKKHHAEDHSDAAPTQAAHDDSLDPRLETDPVARALAAARARRAAASHVPSNVQMVTADSPPADRP